MSEWSKHPPRTAFADLEQLWHEHHADLIRYARRYVGADRAEDVTQDTYCNALKAMLNGNGYTDSARGWLFRIARNRIIDHYRQRGRRPQHVPLELLMDDGDEVIVEASPAPSPHDLAERAETNERLQWAIGGLPVRQMDSIAMRLEGYNNGDIADVMQISELAVKQLNTRAYACLRRRLADVA